tara:strand:+ start:2421 stop:2759 length:339 start_codon:yes stop_codon:yes gene_type:complete
MYYIKLQEEEGNSLLYYCRACGHEENNDNTVPFSLDVVIDPQERKAGLALNKYSKLDPTLPRTTLVKCPKCPESPDNQIIYARTDASNLTYTYMCAQCDTIWNTPNRITTKN